LAKALFNKIPDFDPRRFAYHNGDIARFEKGIVQYFKDGSWHPLKENMVIRYSATAELYQTREEKVT
jgi:hypothetical protein